MVNPPYSPLIAHVFTVPYGGRGRRAPMSLTLENSPGSGHLRNFPAPTLMVGLHNTRLEGGKYLSLFYDTKSNQLFFKTKNVLYCILFTRSTPFLFFLPSFKFSRFSFNYSCGLLEKVFPPSFLSPPLKKAEVMWPGKRLPFSGNPQFVQRAPACMYVHVTVYYCVWRTGTWGYMSASWRVAFRNSNEEMHVSL